MQTIALQSNATRQTHMRVCASAGDWRRCQFKRQRRPSRELAIALLVAGVGVLASKLLNASPGAASQAVSVVALWSGLAVASLLYLLRNGPRGICTFHPLDVLWGIAVGIILRVGQGYASQVDGRPFPQASLADHPSERWMAVQVLPSLLFGPAAEELFFRATLLVAVYGVLRETISLRLSSVASIVFSTIAFALLHVLYASLAPADVLQMVVLGSAFSVIVILTGRIWSALIAHVTYNGGYIVLASIGTLLA